ncbi:hypothetical protein [Hymenobacter metallilatus]|uniref:N-acetyltransferase n=1 Tax=Hymenobacter metallilatus TaxID=2493666 RepID=A0A428JPU5_9BACT|nr:hypothetical protein [Hymenobacter metallilatus]RSK35397.1 hypothetical protein EI290_06775 [Hymenobacter metallilatus]
MPTIQQLPFQGTLPDSFFQIPGRLYHLLPYQLEENEPATRALFAQEAERNDIVLFTDHVGLRLVGIFPREGATAFFGYWETVDDATLNRAAFGQLAAEARRRGYARVQGPLNFNTYHAYRLRLGGPPSWQQFNREPVNPAYYPELLAQLGFRPALTFESRLIAPATVPAVYQNKAELLAALGGLPYEFIPLTPEAWVRHETELFALVHQIFSANPAYQPIPESQFRQLYNAQYAAKLCPHTSVLVREQARGRLVALSLCHPNYAPLHLGPEPPDFRRDYPRLPHKTLLAKTVGVHPDFRQQQLMSYLGAYGMLPFRELYEQVIFCLMRTDNFSLHFTDGLPSETARYALFEQELG